eukprot:9615825-Lingulodinium_polyedra.AAC.1
MRVCPIRPEVGSGSVFLRELLASDLAVSRVTEFAQGRAFSRAVWAQQVVVNWSPAAIPLLQRH